MNKLLSGFLGGFLGATINLFFLCFATGLEKEVYISTSITWIVIGIVIATSNITKSFIKKGAIISLLISSPSFIYILTSSIIGVLWSAGNTIIIGAIVGYFVEIIYKILNRKVK